MGRRMVILDDEVAESVDREAELRGKTADEFVNDMIRATLPPRERTAEAFEVRARSLGMPLIDLDCTARALETLDELEALDASESR
jgi:hypothetical protein